jgi:hypothetical protein
MIIKPNVYNRHVIIVNKSNKLKFYDFKGRDYDYDDLEKNYYAGILMMIHLILLILLIMLIIINLLFH